MTADAWVLRAISDDALVAELLLRIKHSDETFADQLKVQSPSPSPKPPMFVLAGWGKHKARTAAAKKEKSEATRFSPNTPLSWNGGGGDGCGTSASDLHDETSRGSDGKSIARSKGGGGALCVDTASVTAIDKRCRKKRAFSELAEEVALQLKENTDLKKEIANVQMALEEKKAEKESYLKRLKKTDNGSILQSTENMKMERKFVLPDLNFAPPIEEEEDLCFDYNPIHSSIS